VHVTVEPAALLLAAVAVLQAVNGWRQGRRTKQLGDTRALSEGWARLVKRAEDREEGLDEQIGRLQAGYDAQHGELLQLRSVVADLRDELARAEREIDDLRNRMTRGDT
jgi:septal ring factor EnvC (AmiA/AmiB activator)